jgi:hypothetical protein
MGIRFAKEVIFARGANCRTDSLLAEGSTSRSPATDTHKEPRKVPRQVKTDAAILGLHQGSTMAARWQLAAMAPTLHQLLAVCLHFK